MAGKSDYIQLIKMYETLRTKVEKRGQSLENFEANIEEKKKRHHLILFSNLSVPLRKKQALFFIISLFISLCVNALGHLECFTLLCNPSRVTSFHYIHLRFTYFCTYVRLMCLYIQAMVLHS